MSQPTPYERAFNFTNQQAVTPSAPLPADKVDLEYNLIKVSLDETQANMALLQRDDGAVRNQSIGYDQLKPELNGFGFNPPSEWLTATNYIARDTVFHLSNFYSCVTSHISGVFATDLAAGKWLLIADFTAATTAAAASAAAALVSQNAAAASATTASNAAASTDADVIATAADRVQTGLDRVATAADRVQTGLDKVATAADRVQTGSDKTATAADRVQTGLDRIAAAASAATAQTFAFAVSYITQVLTEAQKLVARTNIGAASKVDTRRNLWVNGSNQVSQENGNTLGTTTGYYPVDQTALYFTAASAAMSVQRVQVRTLENALDQIEFKTTTAKASLAAGDSVTLTQNIEGSAFIDAGFGTATAKPVVLRAQVTLPAGTYHWHFQNSAGNRHCAVPFTVSAGEANTAVVKTIVVPPDTSGAWLTADGVIGITCDLVLAVGSTKTGGSASTWGATAFYAAATQFNILSSTSNVGRLADVGLKLDPDATGVYGKYDVWEIDAVYRAERYVEVITSANAGAYNATLAIGAISFTNKKSKVVYSISLQNGGQLFGNAATIVPTAVVLRSPNFSSTGIDFTAAGLTSGAFYSWHTGAVVINARLS